MDKAKAQFYRMLQSLAQAGLPMLRILAQPAPPKLRKAAARLLQAVKEGVPLSEAMRQLPVFTPFEASLVAVGAASGTLDQNFGALADWFESRHAIRSQIISGLVHPAMTYYLAAPIISFINVVTKGVSAQDAIRNCIFMWLAPFAVLWLYRIITAIIFKSSIICEIFDALPLIGSLRHKQETAIFFQALGLCLRGGLGAVAAIRLSADACRYENNRRKFRKMADIIKETGDTFSNAFQQVMSSRDAASTAPVMIATGEATGTLDEYSLRLASLSQQEAKTLLTRLSAILPTIVFVFLAIYIGYVVITFYMGHINQALDLIDNGI
ncbi:MAG: type II secretion system F family protein [Victivallales bacterium]|nr:type II secretion system F family protein [Victivallales bacterium]